MLCLFLSMAWAETVQIFVYKVMQNNVEVGRRNIVITDIPSSILMPDGAKKIEITSDISFRIGGSDIRYQQKGVGQFSLRKANFVISNQLNNEITEFQGKRDSNGSWTVFTIREGSVQKQQFSPLQVQYSSFELFLPKVRRVQDSFAYFFVDTEETLVKNSVWSDSNIRSFTGLESSAIENSLQVHLPEFDINTVWNKDGILLGANIFAFGTELSLVLEELPKEIYFGEIGEKNDFSGIQEQEL